MTAFNLRQVLGPSFAKALEGSIGQETPEFIHPADQPTSVEELPHLVKKIKRDRRACLGVVQKLRHIEADDRAPGKAGRQGIHGIVERPGVIAAAYLAPASQPRMQSFGIRGVQKFDQARQSARRGIERESSPQRLVEIRQFTRAAAARCGGESGEFAEPYLEELYIGGRDPGAGARLNPVAMPFCNGTVFPAQRAYQDLEPPVLVENPLASVSRRASAAIKNPMNTVLPEPVGPQINVWPVSLRLPPSGSVGSLAWSEK